MFSSHTSHPKVVEGFHLPSSAPTAIPGSGADTSNGGQQHGYNAFGVDPSFIFTNSQHGGHHMPSYHHSFSSGVKPGQLSDFDLFDDVQFAMATSTSPPPSGPSASHNPYKNNNGGYNSNGTNGFDPSSFNLNNSASYGSNGANPRQADSFALHQFLSNNNIQSATSHATSSPAAAFASIASPRSPISQDSPNGNHNGSYSSVGESFPSPAAAPATTGSSSTSAKRRPSPPESGRQSRSTGVGKAPSSTTRSRSARRSGSVAQVGAGYAASAQQAIGIPSPGSTGSPTSPPSHPLAISMPAYSSMMGRGNPQSSGGGGVSAGGQSWYSNTSLAYSAGTELDETGWRPSSGAGAVPSSAPVMGSKSKAKSGLDDVLEDPSQKQAALLTEKRRRRRESHNAVERRRRDNINDRITDLAALLPECLLDQVNSKNEEDDGGDSPAIGSMGLPIPGLGTSPGMGVGNVVIPASAERQAMVNGKPNKGIVLAKSVEYIRYLQQLVELHTQRNTELERLVAELRISPQSNPPPEHQSGSHALYASADSPGAMAFSPGSAGEDDQYHHPLGNDWAMGMRLKEESDMDDMDEEM